MVSKVKRLGYDSATLGAMVLEDRILAVDEDDNRLVIGDGSTTGGHPHALEAELCKALDGTPGITETVEIEDNTGDVHTLVFKNGLLTEYIITS